MPDLIMLLFLAVPLSAIHPPALLSYYIQGMWSSIIYKLGSIQEMMNLILNLINPATSKVLKKSVKNLF